MPDRLVSDTYFSPFGVVNRLKSEFSYVETDGEEGARYALKMLERLRAARSQRQVDRDMVERLDRVKNRVLFVCFGDAPSSELTLLNVYVIPGMPLEFEYASATHERAVQPLLERCAAVLGYEMQKDRRVFDQPGYGGQERRHSGRERRGFMERRSAVKDRRE